MSNPGPRTVTELCDRYQAWADAYYQRPAPTPQQPNRRVPTGEAKNMRQAIKPLRATSAGKSPADVRAEDLIACQDWMIARGLSVRVINAQINRIRRVFRWAAKPGRRWIPSELLADLKLIEPIQPGRTAAPNHPKVQPVAWEQVSATMAHADLEQATMIELLWWTGMRPSELINMRIEHLTDESDASGPLIVYRPPHHKTAHKGIKHVIHIGPEGCAVLRPWLRRCDRSDGPIWRYQTANGLYLAIRKINKDPANKIDYWHPYQLRHAWATRMRKLCGLDVTQAAMDHQQASTTEIYAEPDRAAARDAIRKHC